ncbi:MAG: hypothetical protein SGJ27_17125 [Candidatus Melainabacteria bacterium]|nr:hypothetical protein [Candidatus Melainabacteria bacterium]
MSPADEDPNSVNQPNPNAAPRAGVPPSVSGAPASDTAGGVTEEFTESLSFVDELDVRDLKRPLRDSRGRQFSAAGRSTPVAEFTEDFLVLHPPQMPFQDADDGPSEEIVLMMDATGVLVDELGDRKKISGAKYNGQALFFFWEQKPGTLKHYAVFFDAEQKHHYLTVEGERVTTDVIFKLRNMTHDGELTRFKELLAD